MYVLSIEELEKENHNLYTDIAKLSSKNKKNLTEISKLNIEINFLKDSISQSLDTTYKSGYKFLFDKSNSFRTLKGFTIVNLDPITSDLFIEEDKIITDLTIYKTKTDKGI